VPCPTDSAKGALKGGFSDMIRTAKRLSLSFALTLFVFGAASAQEGGPPNRGIAPKQLGDIGRLDARVLDADGRPVSGAHVLLKSVQPDKTCESWNWSDEQGVSVLLPIHIGKLTVTVKRDGYRKLKMDLDPNQLAQPVTLQLTRK
jgi:hypothetical protein